MIVKILGPGCRNCHALEERTREALTQLGLQADIEAVTDYAAIAGYGVMKPPAWWSTTRSWWLERCPASRTSPGYLPHA